MGYDLAVDSLYRLSDDEFRAIPPCDPDLVQLSGHRELGKIASKEQRWLYDLCWAISPDPDESRRAGRPWPKFVPLRAVKRGGEAFLIEALDRWRTPSRVMLKVPLPLFKFVSEPNEPARIESDAPQGSRVVKDSKGMMEVAKSMYRKLEPPKKKREREEREKVETEEERQRRQDLARSVQYERFHRSFLMQDTAHRAANRVDKDRRYGYIPAVIEFGFHPRCYFTQEFIDGKAYIDYIRTHSDDENFDLFLRLIIFIEKAVHSRSIAHCDLHHRNILVARFGKQDAPVLLDFGIAKGHTLPEITEVGSVLGSADTAAPEQMRDPRKRSYPHDIFSAGRLLWTTILRRRPPLDAVLVRRDRQGRLLYDQELEESLARLFDPYALPERFRTIYQLTQQGGYTDISEFRADLEGLFFPEKPATVCSEPCQWLLDERRRVDLIYRAIMGEKEKDENKKKGKP